MESEPPVRVLVEIQPAGKTVSGQVAVEGACATGFFGWLELIDRLERAAAGGAAPDSLREPRAEPWGAP
jgi:hypothetical protein